VADITIKSTSKQPLHGPHILRRKRHKKKNSSIDEIYDNNSRKDYKTNTEMAKELKITPV
jgi:hypothetical protein